MDPKLRKYLHTFRRTDRNYDNPKYIEFRRIVRIRDKFCCQFPGCGARKRLVVHHIKMWANYPNLRYEPSNGILLCQHHHKVVTGREEHYAETFTKIVERNTKWKKKPLK